MKSTSHAPGSKYWPNHFALM